MSFKKAFKIEETEQEIYVSMWETEDNFREFQVKVTSKDSIRGVDLAHVLLEYANAIYDDTKPPTCSSEESQ